MFELTNQDIVVLAVGIFGAGATLLAAGIKAWATIRAARIRSRGNSAGDPANPGPPAARAGRPWRRRPWQVRAALWSYVLLVSALGLTVLGWHYRELDGPASPASWPRVVELWTSSIRWDESPERLLLFWFGLMLAFALVPRRLPKGGGKTSVTWVFDLSAVFLFGPAAAAAISGTTNLLSNLKRGIIRPLFNFFQVVLTVAASAGMYRALGGAFGESVRLGSLADLLAIVGAAATYFLVNSCLVAGAFALDQRIGFRHAWRRNFERQVPEVFLVLVPVGTLLALVQVNFGYVGTLLVLPLVIQMQRAYEGRLTNAETRIRTLRTVANEIDRSHDRTAHHSVRVACYGVRVAWEMGVSAKEAEDIEIAALLHNMGSLTMRQILTKSGQLNESEEEMMRRHPEIAHDLLRSVPGLEGAARLLRFHQERPDGKGYPRGISVDIPKGALVLAAVDAFDAMVNPRPYPRPRMSVEEAYAELDAGAGTQFSADVVRTLVCLHREGRLDEELDRVLHEIDEPERPVEPRGPGDGAERRTPNGRAGEPSPANPVRRNTEPGWRRKTDRRGRRD